MNLWMQGDDLDTYTTMFNDVMSLAGFKEDALGTIVAYWRGLKKALHNAILDKQWPRLQTMVEWQTAARHHNAAWVEKWTFDELHGGGTLGGRLASVLGMQQRCGGQREGNAPTRFQPCSAYQRPQRPCDPDAMDVDVVQGQGQGQRMTDDKRQRLIQEGRCFFCKEWGHLLNACPKKRTRANTPIHARITEVVETVNETVNATTRTPNALELAGYLQGLSENDKAKVLEEILKSDSSF
jgi:hypothetical protein